MLNYVLKYLWAVYGIYNTCVPGSIEHKQHEARIKRINGIVLRLSAKAPADNE